MFVNALSPHGDAGVMRDSTGHSSFRPFDNTLVLWRGSDPSASCEDEGKQRATDEERNGNENCQDKISFLRRNNTRGKKKQKNKTNSGKTHFRWNDMPLDYIFLFLDGFLQKTPQWWLQTCTQECFRIFAIIRHNLISQSLWRTAWAFMTHLRHVRFSEICEGPFNSARSPHTTRSADASSMPLELLAMQV